MKENLISQAVEPSSAPIERPAIPPLRILVVDDDGDLRRLNTEVLLRSGYEVDAAADGAAAWDALSTDTYDLLITDNSMPKVSGIELLQKLRAARMALPVIMATGALPQEAFTRSPWLQPAAIVLKPYTVDEMLRTVQEVLRATDAAGESIQTIERTPDLQEEPMAAPSTWVKTP